VSPGPAAALLGACATAALLADRTVSVGVFAALLLTACLVAPRRRRWPYLVGALYASTAVFVFTPLVETIGSRPLWNGPVVPVLGSLDVTREELSGATYQALRLAAVTLAFAAYALLLDHDRLLATARFGRRSALAVAIATRLLPTLERDAAGFVVALRGRGVAVEGIRGRARLLSPLLAGSLERGVTLAEAMEARGYGRRGATRALRPKWGWVDRAAVAASPALIAIGVAWL
jgi:energy-coupling factor transporter transmembrane protein EcfT